MSDLEGLTRKLMNKGLSEEQIIQRLTQEYLDYKSITKENARSLAKAILEECQKSDLGNVKNPLVKDVLKFYESDVTIGKQGVGCRGAGDFFVHKLIAELSETEKKAFLSPSSLDDAGAIRLKDLQEYKNNFTVDQNLIIVSKMEGIHSRLSDFPFICGFHVTRAALRDLLVKGSRPISILVDTHLGDDSDVSKLFDFMSGVSTISELTGVPITAGSTLRIGGDMVIGNRLVGGIGAVGIANNKLFARRRIRPGDVVLMTEGSGGGTITTTSIYSGNHDVLLETLNVKFLKACEIILNSDYSENIHAMCDVTNGGLRGDLYEINYESNAGVTVYEEKIRTLVNQNVLELLEKVGVDYLGVSLDALLVYCPKETASQIIADLEKNRIKCKQIGYVDDTKEVNMVYEGNKKKSILPKFRESAYTKVKQQIGEENPEVKQEMEKKVEKAAEKALEKRKRIIEYIKMN